MWYFDQHQKILKILEHLDADFLLNCQTYFGGGTLVSLRHGEHRLSNDIDLVCSMNEGYPTLRQRLYKKGYDALFTGLGGLALPREMQVSQYAVRFPVFVDDVQIRFEIVAEGHITLGKPSQPDWSPIPCVNVLDSFSQKLMANADRWPDSRLHRRDLIDLAIMRLAYPTPDESVHQAERWYPVIEPLGQAIQQFQQSDSLRQDCYEVLQVRNPVQIADGLDLLASDLQLKPLHRLDREQPDLERIVTNPATEGFSQLASTVLNQCQSDRIDLGHHQIFLSLKQGELRVWEKGQYFPQFIAKVSPQGWQCLHSDLSEARLNELEESLRVS
jgi:hypothetical protein